MTSGTGQPHKKLVHSSPDIATASTLALAANNERRWALFDNVSDTTVYLTIGGTAVQGQGVRIKAGGNFEMSADIGNLDLRVVNGIQGDTGTKELLVTEG